MKTTILAAFMLALAFPGAAQAAFETDLRYGSQGDEVWELQEFLTAQGVYTGPITGNFYALTLGGVKAFQTLHGVQPVSGFFGPITRGVANGLLAAELAQSDEEAGDTPVVRRAETRGGSGGSTNPTPTMTQPTPAPAPAPVAPAGPQSIEIVSVNPSYELTDTFKVAAEGVGSVSEATDPATVAFLGAIVRDQDGQSMRNPIVRVATPDGNRIMDGTGNFRGEPHNYFFFPINYLFRTAGSHTITVEVEGITESVTLQAQ